MGGEIVKATRFTSVPQIVRSLRTMNAEERAAIGATLLKDGAKGIALQTYRVFQGGIADSFLNSIMDRVQEMIDSGKIPENHSETAAGVRSWYEFFNFVDGQPDTTRFEAFCALFMAANTLSHADGDALLEHQLMQIVNKLSAAQMQTLLVVMRFDGYGSNSEILVPNMLKHVGHSVRSLLMMNMQGLVDAGLVAEDWKHNGRDGTTWRGLSDLGQEFKRRILDYEKMREWQQIEKQRAASAGEK
ncbi:hypothetical protein Acid345_3394 [Candidatus Koribacter versatilis Ellin345]|uniref:Uncharacterized protein n=1 Tax=Koribacter versatilis (strain Ellin345) TaxID=204669 RepID=Q1IL55_KORVE|nr:hypothetical protein [Candidatus Koribacter versatilis]ABF42395.1 hypothetical protein Acid345_3394 [Candidatus Koribacter versatilis Ellin345]